MMNGWILWVAQGFGVGRIPFAPGTWGSLAGLLWFLVLLRAQNMWVYIGGCLLGLIVSVWMCGRAEVILRQTDCGSIVLDEITAMPLCFAGWIGLEYARNHQLPDVELMFQGNHWLWLLMIVAGFRVLDILKPWPIRQSQSLPGGWGVTVDDFLAALYVALASVAAYLI